MNQEHAHVSAATRLSSLQSRISLQWQKWMTNSESLMKKESALIVYLPNKQVQVCQSIEKLYHYKPNNNARCIDNNNTFALINIVSENKQAFTDRQFQRTEKARGLYLALGTLSTTEFKAIIQFIRDERERFFGDLRQCVEPNEVMKIVGSVATLDELLILLKKEDSH